MLCKEWPLPQGVMEPNVDIKEISTQEIKTIIGETLLHSLKDYEELLREEESLLKNTDETLGEKSKAGLEEHTGELAALRSMLSELVQEPDSFKRAVYHVEPEEGKYIVVLRRKSGPPFGEGKEKSQTQIRFSVRETATTEEKDEAIAAESLKGLTPSTVLRRVDQQRTKSSIVINTVSAYRNTAGRTLAEPNAGIRIALTPEGTVGIYGLKYVGNTPHFTDEGEIQTPSNLDTTAYNLLLSYTKTLSGYRPYKSNK